MVRGTSLSELEDALDALLGDVSRADRLGTAGRRHVEEKWTWEIMGQRLRAVLECDRG